MSPAIKCLCLVLVTATFSFGGEVFLPACTEGAGSATDVHVYVTDLNGLPPFTLFTNTTYNVTVTITAPFNITLGLLQITSAPTKYCGLGFPPILPQLISWAANFTNCVENQLCSASTAMSIPPLFAGFSGTLKGNGSVVLPVERLGEIVGCREGDVMVYPCLFHCLFGR